ncbi:MAG: hypothetical protein WA140_13710 [Geobacteraceae bacterium]
MRKILAMMAVIVMTPLLASAQTFILDNSLGDVTGQSGVQFTVAPERQREDVSLAEYKFTLSGAPKQDIDVGVISFSDADGAVTGFGGVGTAGYVGFKGVYFKGVTVGPDWSVYPFLQPMTVYVKIADPGSANDMFKVIHNLNAYADIHLGTTLLKVDSYDAEIVIGNNIHLDNGATPSHTAQTLRSLYIKDFSMTTGADSIISISVNR